MAAETDDSAPEENPDAETETGSEDVAALKAEIAALKDRALRALADAENTRKRAERERDELRQYGIAGFARALLPVADNLDRALAASPPDQREGTDEASKAVIAGVEAVARQLQSVLEMHGIKPIAAEGQRFDPHLHQAIAEVPADGHPPGTVVTVVQGGYTIGERLLRPAMVTVAKSDGEADGAGGQVDTTA